MAQGTRPVVDEPPESPRDPLLALGDVLPMLEQVAAAAATSGSPRVDDGLRIDVISALEQVKAAAAAAQARVEVAFRDSQISEQASAGVPRKDRGRGVADQVALARRISPKQASDQLALRRVLIETLPGTTGLLARGRISEWAAHEVAKEVLVLDDEARALVDAELVETLPSLTAPRAGRAARRRAQELDPAAAVKRAAKAETDRRVSIRPAPDTMVNLTALLPVAEGVAAFAALDRQATALRGRGDTRGRGQIMADTLVEHVTGQREAGDVPVEVQLLMTDTALLAGGDEAALLDGVPVPGAVARRLALGALPGAPRRGSAEVPDGDGSSDGATRSEAGRWIRRLYTQPETGELVAADPRRRRFSGALRRFIALRDQNCRTPWCDAPIRHQDHVQRYADGGETDATNGVGVCERFNHVKEIPGWSTTSTAGTPGPDVEGGGDGEPGAPGHLRISTPTGHVYTSSPPVLQRQGPAAPPLRYPRPPPERSAVETSDRPESSGSPPDPTTARAQRIRRSLPGPRTAPPPRVSRRVLARARRFAADLDALPAPTGRQEAALVHHLSAVGHR